MICWNQLLEFIRWLAVPAAVFAVIVKLLGWFNLVPHFRYVDFEVHQYPWFGKMRRWINFKIQYKFGLWPTTVQASLILFKDGKALPEKYWLSWKEPMNPPEIKIAPFHEAWVRILSVDETDKSTSIPLSVGDGRIGFTPIPEGEYDVQLWLRCSSWGRNHGKKLLRKGHWKLPDHVLREKYDAYSTT